MPPYLSRTLVSALDPSLGSPCSRTSGGKEIQPVRKVAPDLRRKVAAANSCLGEAAQQGTMLWASTFEAALAPFHAAVSNPSSGAGIEIGDRQGGLPFTQESGDLTAGSPSRGRRVSHLAGSDVSFTFQHETVMTRARPRNSVPGRR
jgi:hypothetical protein